VITGSRFNPQTLLVMATSEIPISKSYVPQLILYWVVVGIPLVWGIWKTVAKLPALFQ
jgi:hypothetical protein